MIDGGERHTTLLAIEEPNELLVPSRRGDLPRRGAPHPNRMLGREWSALGAVCAASAGSCSCCHPVIWRSTSLAMPYSRARTQRPWLARREREVCKTRRCLFDLCWPSAIRTLCPASPGLPRALPNRCSPPAP